MRFTLSNISTEKFSINGRTLFKTFIPVFIDDKHITVLNIYDSKQPLIPITRVAEIEVDNVVYTNSTDLTNAIHDVLFSRMVSGAINNEQIELNRLAITALQNDKADANHNHDSRHYTKQQIDSMFSALPANASIDNAVVDGDVLRFLSGGNEIFNANVKRLLDQGNLLATENDNLSLINSYGETLSTVKITAKESYYSVFEFQNNQEDDLTDFIQNDPFTLAKTLSGLYFFVSDTSNREVLKNSRLYLNDIDTFFELGNPTIENNRFKAWQLIITKENYIVGSDHRFNFWQRLDIAIGVAELKDELKKTDVAISGTKVDWSLGIQFTKTLTQDTTLTFSNPLPGKTITLVIDGNFALTLPTGFDPEELQDYDPTKKNYIQIYCVDASPGAEVYLTTIRTR